MNGLEAYTEEKLSKVPADFAGHTLAGFFLFITGLWWSIQSILKLVCKQQKGSSSLITKKFFFRAEILEGIVIIGMSVLGIIGLFATIVKPGQFADKDFQVFRTLHWHHFTIYVFFAMLAGTKILCFTIRSLPVSLVKLMLSNTFFVMSFIFHYHTYGRTLVDKSGHQMLSLVVLVSGLVAFMEFLTKNNALLELLRSSLTLLQGLWFWQLAFVLYPRSKDHAWDLSDYNNIMSLSVRLCLYYALTYAIIGVIYVLITWMFKWRLSKLASLETQLLKDHEQEESEDEM